MSDLSPRRIPPPGQPVAATDADGRPLALDEATLAAWRAALRDAPPPLAPRARERGKQVLLPETWGAVVIDGAFEGVPAGLAALARARPGVRGRAPAQVHIWPRAPERLRQVVDTWLDTAERRPTYLLLVASPAALPLDLEARLRDRFVVGRVWFEPSLVAAIWGRLRTPTDCLDAWCQRVIDDGRPTRGQPAVVLSQGRVQGDDQLATALMPRWARVVDPIETRRQQLIAPSAATLAKALAVGPHLWLHAGYGRHAPDPRHRGSLECGHGRDWLDAIAARRGSLRGGVACLAGCYVGGTTASAPALRVRRDVAEWATWGDVHHELHRLRGLGPGGQTHLSALVTALLGGEVGFKAVVGGYDLLFTSALTGVNRLLSTAPYGDFAQAVLGGQRVGAAFERFVRTEQLLRHQLFGTGESAALDVPAWSEAFTGWMNARQVGLFGDPWVRVGVRWAGR